MEAGRGVKRHRQAHGRGGPAGRRPVAFAVTAGTGPIAAAVDVGVEGKERRAVVRRDAEDALLLRRHVVELEVKRDEGGRPRVDARVDVLRPRLADRLDQRVERVGRLDEEHAADAVAAPRQRGQEREGGGRRVRRHAADALVRRPARERRAPVLHVVRHVERVVVAGLAGFERDADRRLRAFLREARARDRTRERRDGRDRRHTRHKGHFPHFCTPLLRRAPLARRAESLALKS